MLCVVMTYSTPCYCLCDTLLDAWNYVCVNIQGVPGGMCNTSGECSLC